MHLKRFVRKKEASSKREDKGKRKAQPMPMNDRSNGTIQMIIIGPSTSPHQVSLVIKVIIHNFNIQKLLIDNGSKVNLLPYRVLQLMNIKNEHLT
ncbi:hypothetical protein P3X46_019821 [Hevea brasiliensis]|uniref:Retropepsins domain-containing protein n=1 Tax=Hevea brasiliensis TaxID=3981 RepID=A0ABQ9LLV8_HEVBR|nr:hypothetical protein P3X46_019821 [Hevea brasiliensis]